MRNPTRSELLHLPVGLNEHCGFYLGRAKLEMAAASTEVK